LWHGTQVRLTIAVSASGEIVSIRRGAVRRAGECTKAPRARSEELFGDGTGLVFAGFPCVCLPRVACVACTCCACSCTPSRWGPEPAARTSIPDAVATASDFMPYSPIPSSRATPTALRSVNF
jgi:hypothetical protein